jgi:hypothetical protein
MNIKIVIAIIIIINILLVSFIAYTYITAKTLINKSKIGLENLAELKIDNCAEDETQLCNILTNIGTTPYTFNLVKNNFNREDTIYIIKLIAKFIKFLNNYTDTNNKMDVPGLTNQNFIKSKIDTNPLGISFTNTNKTIMYFIFRGTQTVDDLIADTEYNYLYNKDMYDNKVQIHKRYNEIYEEIKTKMISLIPNTITEIYIFGYSMGAAVGYIFGHDISKNKKFKVNVVGIAPPKAGNKTFTDELHSQCNYVMSIINNSDIVPTLPWSYMPNLIDPYTPPQFSQVYPISFFNNLSKSLHACHTLLEYYHGMKKAHIVTLLHQ